MCFGFGFRTKEKKISVVWSPSVDRPLPIRRPTSDKHHVTEFPASWFFTGRPTVVHQSTDKSPSVDQSNSASRPTSVITQTRKAVFHQSTDQYSSVDRHQKSCRNWQNPQACFSSVDQPVIISRPTDSHQSTDQCASVDRCY